MCLYMYMYVCMHVCTRTFTIHTYCTRLPTTCKRLQVIYNSRLPGTSSNRLFQGECRQCDQRQRKTNIK